MSRFVLCSVAAAWALEVAVAQVCSDAPDASGGGSTPIILPPPKSVVKTSFTMECQMDTPELVYNNDGYADGDGPRGAMNASDCCNTCATISGCSYWSFNIDPTLPKTPGKCTWGALNYCCFLHADGTNLTKVDPSTPTKQFGAKGQWSSGSLKPTYAVTSDDFTELRAGPVKQELEISSDSTSIVASDPALLPLATLLSNDIHSLSGIKLNASASIGSGSAGDITFTLLKSTLVWKGEAHLHPESEKYMITVDGNGAAISCYNYTGCAWGVTSLLQTLCISGVPLQTAAFPSFNLTDWPDIPYRGMLLDTARSSVSPNDLLLAAQTARFYKIRYVHLHMTDDHAWTFPSSAFPQLGSQNVGFRGVTPKVFAVDDLTKAVEYADERGVTFIPELEGPGHSSAMRRSDPDFNGEGGETGQGGGVINAANQSVYDGMATIVGEMAQIFKSSPYIHVGCDETSTPPSLPGYDKFAKLHNITDGEDLFAYYVKTMADAVTAVNKKAMIWGPAAMQRLEPDDAVVLVWQGDDGVAVEAEEKGLQWINCPNGGSNQSAEFGRDITDFGNTPGGANKKLNHSSPGLLGVQMNLWEKGWGWLTGMPFQSNGQPIIGTSYLDVAISRTAGPGWWGKSWPRNVSSKTCSNPSMNATSWVWDKAIAGYMQNRLNPGC